MACRLIVTKPLFKPMVTSQTRPFLTSWIFTILYHSGLLHGHRAMCLLQMKQHWRIWVHVHMYLLKPCNIITRREKRQTMCKPHKINYKLLNRSWVLHPTAVLRLASSYFSNRTSPISNEYEISFDSYRVEEHIRIPVCLKPCYTPFNGDSKIIPLIRFWWTQQLQLFFMPHFVIVIHHSWGSIQKLSTSQSYSIDRIKWLWALIFPDYTLNRCQACTVWYPSWVFSIWYINNWKYIHNKTSINI